MLKIVEIVDELGRVRLIVVDDRKEVNDNDKQEATDPHWMEAA